MGLEMKVKREKYRKFIFCCGSRERIINTIFPFNHTYKK